MPKNKKTSAIDAALKELRDFGLKYPGAHTKSPWPGHLDLAVNDKTFAYLSIEGDPFKISCKLPATGEQALMLPSTSPTPYGLGKSGWVTCQLDEGELPPIDIFKEWIDESYRAQAPKKLVKQLSESGAETSAPSPSAKPRGSAAPKKKAASKKARAGKKKALPLSALSRGGAAGSGTRRKRA
ncbi:MAG: MmcQ/YjbR family DNA-binding protein [Polyangiaceae bacterium]